jgi:hypothetical protein
MRVWMLGLLAIAGCHSGNETVDQCSGYPGQTCVSLQVSARDGHHPAIDGLFVSSQALGIDGPSLASTGHASLPAAVALLPSPSTFHGGSFSVDVAVLAGGGSIAEGHDSSSVPMGAHTMMAITVDLHGVVFDDMGGGADMPMNVVCAGGQVCPSHSCCDNGTCLPEGMTCSNGGLCAATNCQQGCGQPFSTCCSDNVCAMAYLCSNGTCVACDATHPCPNNGCCDLALGGKCVPTGATCSGGSICAGGVPCPVIDMNGPPCGSPGQPCCNGTCTNGGCCAGGVCVASNDNCGYNSKCTGGVCNAVCGMAGYVCCAGNSCDKGCCVAGLCVGYGMGCIAAGMCMNDGSCSKPCGGANQIQCPSGPNGYCTQRYTVADPKGGPMCIPCGAPGLACCDLDFCPGGGCCDNGKCVAPSTPCLVLGGTCTAGSCGSCGSMTQPCCGPTLQCSGAFATCSGGNCIPCGGMNKACCDSQRCAPGLVCASGMCVFCGNHSQPCCAGQTCPFTAALTCPGATCN